MSRITPVTGIAFAVLLALVASFAWLAPSEKAEAYSDLRIDVACNPLTSSQSAQVGDPQTCRIRLRNFGQAPISNVTYWHDTPNIGVSVSAKRWGTSLPCDQNTFTCQIPTLNYGDTVIITANYTFDSTLDWRGPSKVYAWGTQAGYPISASATEQKSLP